MSPEIAYCLRCDNVFRASSKRPRCPQCKAIAEVRVLTLDELRLLLQRARRDATFAYIFTSSTISTRGVESVPSDSSTSREERVEDATPKSPTVAAERNATTTTTERPAHPPQRAPPPSFLDPRVNLDSVERMFWGASVNAFTLDGQREWLRENLRHAFLFRVTNADLDSIREKFLERGPPEVTR